MKLARFALLLGSVGCGQTHTYAIDAHRLPCMGEGQLLCLHAPAPSTSSVR